MSKHEGRYVKKKKDKRKYDQQQTKHDPKGKNSRILTERQEKRGEEKRKT